MYNKQAGFTLIELIIVIVILGILAVTAAPRFIDIQSEARTETLNGVKGALQGASQLVFAKAAISGVQKLATADSSAEVTIGTDTVETNFGYPDADAFNGIRTDASASPAIVGIDSFVDLDDDQLTLDDSVTGQFTLTFEGETAAGNCFVRYVNASATGQSPTISVTSTDC